MKDLADLRRLAQDELKATAKRARREARALQKIERRERRRELWPRWVSFWETAAGYIKTAGIVVGGAVAVVSGVITLSRHAADGWRWTQRVWGFYAHRYDVDPATQPAHAGERLGPDRVERPTLPTGRH